MKKLLSTSELNRNYCYMSHDYSTQTEWIKAIIKSHKKGITIGELSIITKLPKSTISARIGDLKQNLITLQSRLDTATNTRVTVWAWLSYQNTKQKITNMDKLKTITDLCLKSQSKLSEQILNVINQ
ncbi:MAG TPA: hypothetical protein PKG70_12495 [Chitinophagales bacterium]|nr:hypothetical protein [Chitinophagales bacterium]HNK12814.1 hypothetical protein [Chitinophagales bacterium]HNK75665.1 hypothetical protein [Chitinophagales bacterium]